MTTVANRGDERTGERQMNAQFRVDGVTVEITENRAGDLRDVDGRRVEYREIDPDARDENGECVPVDGPLGEWRAW